ncbi:MAG TPA: PaaX family transcriptional regulator C-terminal domain-containing protein [Acidimicrobiales bacterium]|nr:PaaX family transcriptional regulator C-terminal domain-containing protein [Acidimicrobiales bacterium]
MSTSATTVRPQPAAAADGGTHHRTTLRRHALAPSSARGLLLTVMGELQLPTGAAVWTSAFLEVLGRLGVAPGTGRQALNRTAAAGWLTPERVGRRTRWRISPAGERLLSEGSTRIYGFAGPDEAWDGRWLVVLASVPEADRAGRHFLRSRLTWAGLGSPAPGVWVGTHAARLAEVEDVLGRAGAAGGAQVFVAEHAGPTPVASLVAAAWDLAAIDRAYGEFLAEFAEAATDDPLRRVVELVHAWRRFPWSDPALPGVLLPEGWRGAAAARLFHDRHDRWSGPATESWARIAAGGG